MNVFTKIVFSFALFASLGNTASVTDVGCSKDATVVFNLQQCGDSPCALINHGTDNTLAASLQNDEVVRMLIGFDLPAGLNKISQCQLRLQQPVSSPGGAYMLTASEASNDWDEDLVNGQSNIPTGNVLGSVDVSGSARPDFIDVTAACKYAAKNSRSFSVWIDSSGPAVIFPSRQTGASTVLRIVS
ncbi:hypothetical protein DL89DRAFT_39477 [Linderina pennispora]|uniref:Carbohydrate-binding module family 96 domain-containing protein n=1 Tax=Linderina pennispora TaxID=61395 RepID=A0A1Y1W378_9FUNG|nr:uncharacterized protein DL89DRAFT_39477 [Linderina pennispora]ORX67981.1 hypothetical protein DL89DRAFT_39477 [Linderina pennispora]